MCLLRDEGIVSEGGVEMKNLNIALRFTRPLSHWGRARVGEQVCQVLQSVNISWLPGVARRLVTFFCFAKKKVTKEKATPIHHLFEVPCVARQLRRLRNSHCVLRQSSPTTPELSPLLGGGRGEGKAKSVQWMLLGAIYFSLKQGFVL